MVDEKLTKFCKLTVQVNEKLTKFSKLIMQIDKNWQVDRANAICKLTKTSKLTVQVNEKLTKFSKLGSSERVHPKLRGISKRSSFRAGHF